MKQKNIILVAVAVGCGLVAAILTSRMSAGPAKVEDTVEVPVAAKDLPLGTKLSKDELNSLVVYKKFTKDNVPNGCVEKIEELTDKKLARAVNAGFPFAPTDMTTLVPIQPPPGKDVITFVATAEKGVAGFAGPGSKVDVLASIKMKSLGNERAVVFPLFTDMLVLAIDTATAPSPTGGAMPNVGMVSLAVDTKQALMLHAAIGRGADLRLLLRHPDAEKSATWKEKDIPSEEEILRILADDPRADTGNKPKEEKAPDVVKLPVPVEDIPAGTQLTQEVLDTKFKTTDFIPPAPANVVQNLKEFAGKYVTKDLGANTFIPKTFIGAKPDDDKFVKPGPVGEQAGQKQAPADPAKAKPKPDYFDTVVQTSSGTQKYRYQRLDSGEYRFLGPVRDEDPNADAKDDDKTLPVPESKPESKPDPKPAPGEKKKKSDEKKPADDDV
ncbi:Flp pilus assembly protein CpaB [Fimbriiglobus ruber]|uniref:Flp pilus assembly protein RcpC/CpaB n=1 Tax=Fimbriiglobus ruber TaxID=1908690 RepID=A0A225DPS6_9BACT|nr:Flp pilus assembly protein CpaB [Fimbriiglobus ruber]OWK41644.1 Flp pilus assembly protein RcpC/CpaB [Fimbriiglobus ruber]